MSEHEKNSLLDCLFSGQDMELDNIKFCRGASDLIGPDDLRAEAHSALIQRRTGAAHCSQDAPRSEQPLVDLRALFG